MAAYQVGQLVEKMSNPDKDFRFMAINDLMHSLTESNALVLDEDSAAKVVRALVKLLEDQTGEVQNLAIRCLGVLTQANKLRQTQVEWLVDAIIPQLIRKDDPVRDVFTMALKNVITNLPPAGQHGSFSAAIAKKIVPRLDQHLMSKTDETVKIEVIDLLGEVLLRFGDVTIEYHNEVHAVLLEQLKSSRQTIRKRCINAFGYLAAVASSQLYDVIVAGLLDKLGTAKGPSTCRTYIVALTFVAKSSGAKFSDHLSKVVPYLIQFLRSSEDDELKESSLQGLEVFLYRCPSEVASFQTDVQQVLAANLSFDPNYEYGEDDDDVDMESEGEEEEGYSDDEDVSWKVRRAAAKAIEAMIVSRRENLLASITTLGPLLISRFREREETVRNEILSAYIALLSQVIFSLPNIDKAVVTDSDGEMHEDVVQFGNRRFSSSVLSSEQLSIIGALDEQKDRLIKALIRLLRRNGKSSARCLELLSALVQAYPGVLESYFPEVLPGVYRTLTEKAASAQSKMTALAFISRLLENHQPQAFQNEIGMINDVIVTAIEDPFYKISGEGLVLSVKFGEVVKACTNAGKVIEKLFNSANSKYSANDTDQDVRERSIIAVAHLVSTFPEELKKQTPAVLEKLTDRMKREMTCLIATRAFGEIASSSVAIDPATIAHVLTQMADFVRKSPRSYRLASLSLVESLMKTHDERIPSKELTNVFNEVTELISENDLQISHQALRVLAYGFNKFPRQIEIHLQKILKRVVILLQSSLLQGVTLNGLMDMLVSIVTSKISNKPKFEELLDHLTAPVYDKTPLARQCYSAISTATAVVATATKDLPLGCTLAQKLAEQFLDKCSTEPIRLFALGTIGELGRRFPAVYDGSQIEPENLAMGAFETGSEDLKAAAAHALGALAVGNLHKFLPFILKQIQSQLKHQYLLLHALKEIILWESTESQGSTELFRSAISDIWQLLIASTGGNEEGARGIVAECLGRLCAFDPPTLLPHLKDLVHSPNGIVRATVVSAVKYLINDDKRANDPTLQKTIENFLSAVKDDDLNVRRAALVVLNSAAHNRPALIRDLLPHLLPAIYIETQLRTELIREVEMGPFKHQVDDGLDLRKCAFECMYTLLENCSDKIDANEFLAVMEVGLKDPSHDVRLLNYLTLQKIAVLAPGQVLQRLEKICEPLKQQLTSKPKGNAVKQELEKLEELKKGAIRVIFTLKRLPDVERQQQFVELHNTIKSNKELREVADAVVKESQRAVVYDVPMEA
ncbi:unnamed protein product [Caenorhabditis auriculariae]|uniref:TATA-binding protein interacting (TIP20) domain-containing protein n=1 Tax=Caenorhabditis auriculariae TaxID=2777116 RepID=A0A8S1HE35_9PELO|nr:unnamed protein product [Caenorhabditis auriculariae]